jgi:hypothetical protein
VVTAATEGNASKAIYLPTRDTLTDVSGDEFRVLREWRDAWACRFVTAIAAGRN